MGLIVSLILFVFIKNGLCKNGREDEAIGVFEKMKVEGMIFQCHLLLKLLIYGYCCGESNRRLKVC